MSPVFYVCGRGFLWLIWGQGNEGPQPPHSLIQTRSCFLGRAWPGCAGPHGSQERGVWRLGRAGVHRHTYMQGHREVGTEHFRDMGVRGVPTHLLMHPTPSLGWWSPPGWNPAAAAFPACPLAWCGQLQALGWLRVHHPLAAFDILAEPSSCPGKLVFFQPKTTTNLPGWF